MYHNDKFDLWEKKKFFVFFFRNCSILMSIMRKSEQKCQKVKIDVKKDCNVFKYDKNFVQFWIIFYSLNNHFF